MTSLTTKSETGLSTQVEPVGMSGEADQSDFIMLFVTLVQAGSAEGTAGKFRWTDGSEFEEVNFVCIHIARTRTFFLKDEGLVCRSSDRRTGYPVKAQFVSEEAADGQPFACQACPHSQDKPFVRDGCRPDFLLTCYDTELEEPFLLRVKGAARGVFLNKIISAVARGKQPPWAAVWKMTATRINDREKGRNWWEPRLELVREFDDDERAQWQEYTTGQHPVETGQIDPDDLPFE